MKKLALALFATVFATAASAAEIKPAIVYDLGTKYDKSFNEGVFNGAEKFKAETGIEFREFETQNASQYEQALTQFAEDGNNPVLAVGFSQEAAVKKVAADFPDTSFVIIDAPVDLPNVQSVLFKEHEGSFLVGLLAAKASQSAKVGFIGGMDIPLIRRFACGYVQGAKYANSSVEVFENMTGTTPEAWNDPVKGGELAALQIERGADVVYAAAGATGIGVLQKAADLDKLGIGVDSNQNHLHPGEVLTSMLKRVDVATYSAFMAAKDGTWKPGISVLGLAEDGVGWADDDNNKSLITDDMRAAVDKAKADIVAGTITVHDYMSDSACPM